MAKNTYHFVPIQAGERRGDLGVADFEAGKVGTARHDRYIGNSGTIQCQLTLKTSTFVGATRITNDNAPAEVEMFRLDGKPAIPGSSLRGMIGSVIEAASNSAFRVFGDQMYSWRKRAEDAHQNLGAIYRDESGWRMVKLGKAQGPHANVLREGLLYFFNPDGQNYRTWTDESGGPYYGIPNRCGVGERPTAWDRIPESERSNWTQGIVRMVDCPGRDLPENRHREVFVPLPEGWLTGWRKCASIPIRPEAVKRFQIMADERGEDPDLRGPARLPYEPVGTSRGGEQFQLKDGDLMYYSESAGQVGEFALSAIWRATKGQTARDFLRIFNSELLPFNKQRTSISIGELLLGFVEENVKCEDDQKTRALAGRVRFCTARVETDQGLEPEVTLPILSSPKPPCPAMYFRKAGQAAFIAKRELSAGPGQRPQGRKFYLNPRGARTNGGNVEKDAKQRVRITPLRAGSTFRFEVRFDNLSDLELGLLCYALKPTADFHHKLGMGKPLGMGSVALEILDLSLVDRKRRYSSRGVTDSRYLADKSKTARAWADEWAGGMNAEIRTALELLGKQVTGTVCPPYVDVPWEAESYRFFVENETGRHWFLRPITASEGIPNLPED